MFLVTGNGIKISAKKKEKEFNDTTITYPNGGLWLIFIMDAMRGLIVMEILILLMKYHFRKMIVKKS